MTRNTARRHYLIGAIIVWVGIYAATALTLDGDDLASMFIFLSGGAFWFIVLAPQLFLRVQENDRRDTGRHPDGA